MQKFTHIIIVIKKVTFSQEKKARFLSAAKLLLFCQPCNSIVYEKVSVC